MLFKKLIRTMGVYKAQFISMIIMIALGSAIFIGFNMEWYAIDYNVDNYFAETGYADFRVIDENARFTAADAEKLKEIDGVKEVSRFVSVNAAIKNSSGDVIPQKSLALTVTENPAVSFFKLIKGEKYDPLSTDGIWISDKFAEKNSIEIGDELRLSYAKFDLKGIVKGFCKSGEYLVCVEDEAELMPKFEKHGFAFISPVMFSEAVKRGTGGIYDDYYPQINVIAETESEVFKPAAQEKIGRTLLILSKEESGSYALAQGEAEEGKTMGAIFPALFLLIAVLTMVTTMHRVTAKEKLQIGTLKALGFKDRRITLHYTSYAFAVGVVGCAIGIALGLGICAVIMNPNGMMGTYFDMPEWKLIVPWFCWLAVAAIICFLTLIGFLSVKKMLKGTAADALRPYSPKKMTKLAVEKTGMWKKFSFGTKWNLRDIMRHKSRTLMSLIGIIGCTIIVVGSVGMRDTMNGFIDTYYKTAMNYVSKINVADDADKSSVDELVEKYDGDYSGSVAVEYEEKAYTLEIYSVPHDKVKFLSDKGNKTVRLEDGGAYVCRRIAEKYGLKKGSVITVKPFGRKNDVAYTFVINGIIRSQSESIVITSAYAEMCGVDYGIKAIYASASADTIENDKKLALKEADGKKCAYDVVKTVQTKDELIKTFDSFTGIMDTMIILLVAVGVALGIVVLYNLGTMSYTERYREMATLKVVGFKDKNIGKLLIGQNLWVTVIGVLLGVPLGVLTLKYLVVSLAAEYEMNLTLGAFTYISGVAVTFGVSLLVGFMVARKNKKIDMVEALKGAE